MTKSNVSNWDGVGWPTELTEPPVAEGMGRVKRNKRCPYCKFFTAVYFANTNRGALYRCMKIFGRHACGRYFEGPRPDAWRP